jgi:zinc-binding alcohol dehydrogenase family protein
MKAVAYNKSLPIDNPEALLDIELDKPEAQGRDILVRVEAVAVNPVDTKIRRGVSPENGEYKVLGWDATGVVEAIGDQVELFAPGDRVWYAGAIDRPGCNTEYHLVDQRIVAKMPNSLSFSEAAALPLTGITAWEILFDRLKLNCDSTGHLLIIGGAGGVGSIMIQLARRLTRLTVIATASRPETIDWVQSLGAQQVINHHQPLTTELEKIGIQYVEHVASLTHTGNHLRDIAEIIAPQGSMAVIDDPDVLDIMPFKKKSVAIHWELMFTRSLFHTDDIIEQHRLLTRLAEMVDKGEVRTTLAEHFGVINATNLMRAHQLIESGKSKGKIVLEGF